MNITEINPYIRLAAPISTIARNVTINRRIIFDYELLYIQSGDFILTYNDIDFHIKDGDILLLCPNIPHSFHDVQEEVKQPHIHFDLKYDYQSTKIFINYQDYPALTQEERLLIRENIFLNLQNSPHLKISNREIFLGNFYYIINAENQNSLSVKSRMLELLALIIEENAPNSLKDCQNRENIVSHIKNYIDANYEHNFQLADLEKQFCYSKFHIDKLFKQKLGCSVMKYRNHLRLIHSVQMLQKYSVSKTAQMLGFSSIYTFSRAFRSFYNISPSEYIRKLKETEHSTSGTDNL